MKKLLFFAFILFPSFCFLNAQSVVDCGKSDFDLQKMMMSQDLSEENETLKCLGRNILDDCRPASAFLNTTDHGEIKFIVEGDSIENCKIRLEYGDMEQIQNQDQKEFANTYSTCPFNIIKLIDNDLEKAKAMPGGLAISTYISIGVMSLGDTQCENGEVVKDVSQVSKPSAIKSESNKLPSSGINTLLIVLPIALLFIFSTFFWFKKNN
jgi:hypothetical protein